MVSPGWCKPSATAEWKRWWSSPAAHRMSRCRYQSARSHLNIDVEWGVGGVPRIERPEAKAAFTGGRCMRFK